MGSSVGFITMLEIRFGWTPSKVSFSNEKKPPTHSLGVEGTFVIHSFQQTGRDHSSRTTRTINKANNSFIFLLQKPVEEPPRPFGETLPISQQINILGRRRLIESHELIQWPLKECLAIFLVILACGRIGRGERCRQIVLSEQRSSWISSRWRGFGNTPGLEFLRTNPSPHIIQCVCASVYVCARRRHRFCRTIYGQLFVLLAKDWPFR